MSDSLRGPLLEDGPGVRHDHDHDQENENENLMEKAKVEDEKSRWLLAELKHQLSLAVPMVAVNLLQYSLNIVSVIYVGHLGELQLASAALATSIASVTGFSVLSGMSSALETLCGQAYGAKQYHLLGIYLQRAIVVLSCVAVPMAFVWFYMDSLLRLIGQDAEISHFAGLYARGMLPQIFAIACAQPLVRFLQTQSLVLPMALSSALTLCIHIPLCWLLVYKSGVGYRGAAFANAISQWLNVLFLAIYIKFSPRCKRTWRGLSTQVFSDMKPFITLAVPSTLMICLEYWSFEFIVLLSGLLPNPQLETSALSISLNTIALMYMFPYGLGAAASTRVSNELGAGRASVAKRAVAVAMGLALAEGLTMATIAFSLRHVWAYVFTSVPEVASYVSSLMTFLSLMAILDACQGVLSGVTRGCGAQALGAFTNLGSYYIVGLPLAVTLAFHFNLNGEGLWLGIIAALLVQTAALGLITIFSDWERQAQAALDRVRADRLPTNNKSLS